MKNFIVIEVGSTNTKSYMATEHEVKELDLTTIEWKKHYKELGILKREDIEKLYDLIRNLKEHHLPIYVFGTSIFRSLKEEEKTSFLNEFKKETNVDFQIVSAEKESELTVYGVINNIDYDGRIAVMIGGGGSTEVAVIDKKQNIETVYNKYGAGDVCDEFPDINTGYATTPFDAMVNWAMDKSIPLKQRSDILVLAGGDYLKFYQTLGYELEENTFYNDPLQPLMISKKNALSYDEDFFYHKSLEEIQESVNDVNWWNGGTRGMRICVQAITNMLNSKYIIPTKINMIIGLANKIRSEEEI